ncbi:MAG: hypothetical protein PHO75_03945, partial [Candidatus Shapirobacteria bacterium]|nr:hypothetical protein [Candidatus Shapirobacteria bacterium]
MASNTENLGLYKKDPLTDKGNYFDIKTMLNENWNKIDDFAEDVEDTTLTTQTQTADIITLPNVVDGQLRTALQGNTDTTDGLKSVGDTRVRSVGKNLFSGLFEAGSLNTTTGEKTVSSSSVVTKDFIPLTNSDNYTITTLFNTITTAGSLNICFYDKSKSYLGFVSNSSAINGQPFTFTKLENAVYILFRYYNGSNYQPSYVDWSMVEENKGQTL